jgi:phosphatidylethanolamine/phosphatidyl-N-methylethanolamine N-methyltransferase
LYIQDVSGQQGYPEATMKTYTGSCHCGAVRFEIDTEAPGAVVELGPGTGRVTRALLEAGVEPSRLVAIERDASFCKLLRERFPAVRIVSGKARALEALLQQVGVGPVKAVVSSLPLLTMTCEHRSAVLSQIAAVIGAEGVLVQYTYGMAAPVPPDLGAELGVIGERTNWVLANLPPAEGPEHRGNTPEKQRPRQSSRPSPS